MEQSQALSLLALDSSAALTRDVIETAFAAKQGPLQVLIDKAPSEGLKAKYRGQLDQLKAAREQLLSGLPMEANQAELQAQPLPLTQTKLDDLPSAQVRHSQFEDQTKAELGLQTGQLLASRYEIQEQIGAGGMGAVYRAFDGNTQKEIALKVMLPSLLQSERARERFMDEARLSQQLSHPNIVNVFDVQQEGDYCFLTMELLEGQDLRSYMENLKLSRQPIAPAEAIRIASAICDGLAHAHEITIHRDIKPENIFLTGDGKIKIMDFGIARVQSTSQRTQTGAAMGTAYYMAPEQLQARTDIDGRADQYAVGVLLYEMLSGQVPAGRVESLRTLDKHIPKKLSEVVDKLLSGQPEQRFEKIQELKEALEVSNKQGALSKVAMPDMAKFAIPAVVITCTLLLGGLFASGFINMGTLKSLLPMGQEEIAQRKATNAGLAAEIKNLQKRLENGRRSLDRDLRDAERNDTKNVKALQYWQVLTEDSIFEGAALADLEGQLAMADVLLRDERFDAAEQKYQQVKEGYTQLYNNFMAAEKLYQAEQLGEASHRRYQELKKKTTYGESEQAQHALNFYAQAKEHQRVGESQQALMAWQELVSATDLAIQEIEETYAQEKLAKAEQLSWNKLQKEYAVQAPGEEGDAQKFVALAVEQQVRGQLKLARENWLGAQTQWQSAHQTVAKQIAAIDQQREDRRAEAVRAQRIAEAESARKTRNEAAWAKAKHSNTLAAYEEYLQSHENKDYTEQANNRVDQIYKQINPIVNQLLEGMISIPSGSFMMGSNDGPSEERPVHLVEIRAFKLGATEVTFQQWDACVSAGFCRELDDRGWGKGDRPAINVSYNDITQQFIPWLNKTTGKTFRLPSEAEWEYAARAGTTTPFSTGQCITPGQANFSYDEKYDSFLARMGCDALAKHSRHKTIVAKSFSPNAFGLYDMHGNVTEWTQDCFNLRYNGAPKDGSAWLLGKCKDRMVRGGAWNNGPLYLRSTHRDSLPVTFNYNSFVGFRLAQDP